jgi:hypothetical protein
VPHPDEVDELEDDMSHLMEEKDSDDSSDDEDKKENSESSTVFKERIEAIMKATEADGVDRDDELKAVVAEMLATAGPDAAAALSEQLQALEKK